MNFETYRPLGLRTEKPLPTKGERLRHASLGMLTEVGEMADPFKRLHIYSKLLDNVNTAEEVADFLWYLNILLDLAKIDASAVDALFVQSLDMRDLGSLYPTPLPHFATQWERDHAALTAITAFTVGILMLTESDFAHGTTAEAIITRLPPLFVALRYLCRQDGLYEAMDRNIEKLRKRFPNNYSDFDALNRDTTIERQALEAPAAATAVVG